MPVGAPIGVIGAVGEEVACQARRLESRPVAQAPAAAPARGCGGGAEGRGGSGRARQGLAARAADREGARRRSRVGRRHRPGRAHRRRGRRACRRRSAGAAPAPAATRTVAPAPGRRRRDREAHERQAHDRPAPHRGVAGTALRDLDVRRHEPGRAAARALVALTPEGAARPTYSDVLTKVCAVALLRHPALNAHYVDGEIRRFSTVNVGIAVAIPERARRPVIRSCER